jgi:competence protein ComEC
MIKKEFIEKTFDIIRKRIFFTIAFLFITAIILYGVSPALAIIHAASICIILMIECIYNKNPVYLSLFFIIFISLFLFILRLDSFSNDIKHAYKSFDKKNVEVTGRIRSIPVFRNQKYMFIIKPDRIKTISHYYIPDKKLNIQVYANDIDFDININQNIKIRGFLLKPAKKRYKNGFNTEMNLYHKQLAATVYANTVFEASGEEIEESFDVRILKSGTFLRNRILEIIYACFPEKEAGLFAGMLTGVRTGLSEELYMAFSNSGLLHIMAVSGANILFLLIPIFWISKKLKINRFLYLSIAAICIMVFIMITGFEQSVIRASIMATVYIISKMVFRRNDVYISLSISCIIMLIVNPFNIYNIGFILSYSAVISLAIFYNKFNEVIFPKRKKPKPGNIRRMLYRMKENIKEAFIGVISVQTGVTPVSMFLFNSFSVVSVLNNVLVSLAVVGVTIYGMFIIIYGFITLKYIEIIAWPCKMLLKYIIFIVEFSTKLSFSKLTVLTPGIAIIILFYIFIIWIFKSKAQLKNIIGIWVIFIVILTVTAFSGSFLRSMDRISFINIGQGDAILIETGNNSNILIDSGVYEGDRYLLPYLLDKGVRKLDILIATHSHEDHINGFNELMDYFKVGALILPAYENQKQDFQDLIYQADIRNIPCYSVLENDIINTGKSDLFVLNPQKEFFKKDIPLNNTSIVLKYCYDDFSILLTGDIEGEIESILISEKKKLRSDVLKVPHHGSETSSGRRFLKAVGPKVAVISVGYNRFNHPESDVLERLLDTGALIYRTDINSEITIKTNGRKYIIDSTY